MLMVLLVDTAFVTALCDLQTSLVPMNLKRIASYSATRHVSECTFTFHRIQCRRSPSGWCVSISTIFMKTNGLIVRSTTFGPLQFNENKESAYILHKQLIQLLSLRYQPKSCWLLKAPLHSFYPEVLLKTYPDARIIVTHRDHLEAVPSW